MSQMQRRLVLLSSMFRVGRHTRALQAFSVVIPGQQHTFCTISAKMAEQLHMSTAGA